MWIRIDYIRIRIRIRIRIHKVGSIRIRIQVHKISKFSKHLLIFESKKKLLIFKALCTYFFKGSELKHIISCENKYFCWLNSAFPLILSVILCLWIRIRIRIRNSESGSGSGSTDPNESGSDRIRIRIRIRIHITGKYGSLNDKVLKSVAKSMFSFLLFAVGISK